MSSFVGIGGQVRSLFGRKKPPQQIPARPRLGVLKFRKRGFVTVNVCLKRFSERGIEKLSNLLNDPRAQVFQDVKITRARPADRDKFLPYEKAMIRGVYGCGRPPKDKTSVGAKLHMDLIEAHNAQAAADRAARGNV